MIRCKSKNMLNLWWTKNYGGLRWDWKKIL